MYRKNNQYSLVIFFSSKSGETNAVVGEVEGGVVLAHENVAQYPQRPHRWWHVQTEKSGYAQLLTCLAHLLCDLFAYNKLKI